MNPRYRFQYLIKENDTLQVWKAFDELSMQPCLVKKISRNAPEIHLHQFRMEEQVLAALTSPWVPKLLDMETDHDSMMLYETWIEGMTLAQWLAGRPSKQKRRHLFCQITDLIDELHQAGFLYLDLKPDNVLVHAGHAYLIDFNACIFVNSQEIAFSNRLALPPEYGSRSLNPRADQIGLGNLHQLMFGKSKISWKCLQENPDRRFRNLSVLKKNCQPACPVWKPVSAGVLIVSVFLLILLKPADKLPVYISSPAQLLQQLEHKEIQMHPDLYIYQWMEKGQIDPDLLNSAEAVEIMQKAAVQYRNVPLCRTLVRSVPSVLLGQNPLMYIETCLLGHIQLEAEFLSKTIQSLSDAEQAEQQIAALCGILLDYEMDLSEEQFRLLQEQLEKVNQWQSAQVLIIMQYLLLEGAVGMYMECPASFQEVLLSTSSGKNLWEIYTVSENMSSS